MAVIGLLGLHAKSKVTLDQYCNALDAKDNADPRRWFLEARQGGDRDCLASSATKNLILKAAIKKWQTAIDTHLHITSLLCVFISM